MYEQRVVHVSYRRRRVPAFVYAQGPASRLQPPSDVYLDRIIQEYRTHGLDLQSLGRAIRYTAAGSGREVYV